MDGRRSTGYLAGGLEMKSLSYRCIRRVTLRTAQEALANASSIHNTGRVN